jgi:hypothetical protein
MSDRRHARPRTLAPSPTLLALLLAGLCPLAGAETNPWYLGVSQTFAYDSNLYRADDTRDLNLNRDPSLQPLTRSDTISTTSLVGGIDQPIGRQRVFGNASVGYNGYANNDYLNSTSYSLTGGLDWSTVERFSGKVSVAASEQQRKFNDTNDTEKNLERVNQVDAVFRAGTVTRLTLEGSLGFRKLDYSAAAFASSEYDQTRGSIGVRYRPGIATFSASVGLADTDYNTTTERVRRTSLDLTGSWPANGVSSLFVRLSPTRVEYDQFSQRDFNGLTGSLRWNWLPTGKLNVETRLVHDIGQDSSFETFGAGVAPGTNNTGRVTTELRVAAAYELSAKVAMNAALSTAYRSLEETKVDGNSAVVKATGNDNTIIFSLGASWTPLRSTQVGCNLGRDQRSVSGNISGNDAYSANTVSCYGQFTLQ